ncbi:helix-turn-helix domain-containing protein [Salipiger abyssi]|uniref:helix-turn-helix domain-containing protein n=1 Tax=Salipiger abyssi TaxID=1250539 RepID=UPI004059435B
MNYPETEDGPEGPYDPAPAAEEDLWFLPAPPDPDAAGLAPLPRADRRALLPLEAWRAAQAAQAAELARAALAFGALEQAAAEDEGLIRRLALTEASEISWQAGLRAPPERLALYGAGRLLGLGDAARDMARAHWARRRLEGGADPVTDPAGFLGRRGRAGDRRPTGWEGAPQGGEFAALAEEWQARIAAAEALHPFVRAALAEPLWRALELSAGEAAGVEARVASARIAAVAGRGRLGFVPVAMGGRSVSGGGAEARLAGWLHAAEQGALRGLLIARRLSDWQARAAEALSGLSGRTPPALITVLRRHPLVPAALAVSETGASAAAVQRNLALLEARGLIRERSGQSRFRFWEAAL